MALKQVKKEKGLRVGKQGRLVIPAHIREELGLKEGDRLIAFLEDGRLTLDTPEHALKHLQKLLKSTVPPGVSVVDEFLAWRREEARKEAEKLEGSDA